MIGNNAFYAQSGGPTAVINATASGVIEAARCYSDRIHNLCAGQYGILGAIEENLIDTTLFDKTDLKRLRHTPGAAFGTCRYKLGTFSSQPALYDRIFDVFHAHRIHYFFYNGGGDSQDTIGQLASYSRKKHYPLTCIGIPKTIDNDMPLTDTSPGFGSAAKYVATSTLEIGLDVRAVQRNSTRVFIIEVMGRYTGWLAASAGLSSRRAQDPPHLILFPEIPFDETAFLTKVKQILQTVGYCIIIVAEGIRNKQGQLLSTLIGKDAFNHVQLGGVGEKLAALVQASLKVKNRWTTLNYLQRSAAHLTSQTDIDNACALGKAAVEFAILGKHNCMPILVRSPNSPCTWTIGEAPLEKIAHQERCLPLSFIRSDGFHITSDCRKYLTPLIQGESYPVYREGLPDYYQESLPTIPKKLTAFY